MSHNPSMHLSGCWRGKHGGGASMPLFEMCHNWFSVIMAESCGDGDRGCQNKQRVKEKENKASN